MNESDIEFTVSLDTSPALQKFDEFQDHMSMADAAFQRATGQFERPSNYAQPNIGPTGANYPSSGSMADRFFEKTVSDKLAQEADILAKSENSIYSKIRNGLLAKASAIREKFDTASNGGVPPKSPNDDEDVKKTEEINQNEQEITEEAKAQNREMNEHHIKLGKTLTIVGSILAIVKAIKNAWKSAFDQQARLMSESGFISKDPASFFKSGSDRTYQFFIEGIRNMGKASPITENDFNSLLTRLQTAREKAMKGEGIDEPLTIAIQQLNDTLGTGLNAKQLLTGDPNRTNVEILKQLLDSVEKSFPKIARMNETDRTRTLGYVREVLGPVADALSANYSLNLRTGGTKTVMEKVESHGGSALTPDDYASSLEKITSAGSELKEAFENLKKTLTNVYSPALTSFVKGMTNFVTWLNGIFHFSDNKKTIPQIYEELTYGPPESVRPGRFDRYLSPEYNYKYNRDWRLNLTKKGLDHAYSVDRIQGEEGLDYIGDIQKKVNELGKTPDVIDRLNSVILGNLAQSPFTAGEDLEGMKKNTLLKMLYRNRFNLSESKYDKQYETASKEYIELATTYASLHKSIGSELQNATLEETAEFLFKDKKADKFANLWSKFFTEGGQFDVDKHTFATTGFIEYLLRGLPKDDMVRALNIYAESIKPETSGERFTTKPAVVNGQIVMRIEGLNANTQTITTPINDGRFSQEIFNRINGNVSGQGGFK